MASQTPSPQPHRWLWTLNSVYPWAPEAYSLYTHPIRYVQGLSACPQPPSPPPFLRGSTAFLLTKPWARGISPLLGTIPGLNRSPTLSYILG